MANSSAVLACATALLFGACRQQAARTSGQAARREKISTLKCADEALTRKRTKVTEQTVSAWCERSGVRHGAFISLGHDGKRRAVGRYEQGERTGLWSRWYDSGAKWVEGSYKAAKREGLWTEWTGSGGRLRDGPYSAGRKHGIWSEWRGKQFWLSRYLGGERFYYTKLRLVGWSSDGKSIVTEGRLSWKDHRGASFSVVEVCPVPRPCEPFSRCRIVCGPCKQKAEQLSELRSLKLVAPSPAVKVFDGKDRHFTANVSANRTLRVALVRGRQKTKAPTSGDGSGGFGSDSKGVFFFKGAEHYGLFLDEQRRSTGAPFAVFEIIDFGFDVDVHFAKTKQQMAAIKIDRHLGDDFFLPALYPLTLGRTDNSRACSAWLPSPYEHPPARRYVPAKPITLSPSSRRTLRSTVESQLPTLDRCFDLGALADKPRLPAHLRLEIVVSPRRVTVKKLFPPTGSEPYERCVRQIVAFWKFAKTSCESYRVATGIEVRAEGVRLLGKPVLGRDGDNSRVPCSLPALPDEPFSLAEAMFSLEASSDFGMGMPPEVADGEAIVSSAENYVRRFGQPSRFARLLNTIGNRLYHDDRLDGPALALFRGAAKMDPSFDLPRYNAARIHAKRDEVGACVAYLRELAKMRSGPKGVAQARKDAAFNPVWGNPIFEALFKK